MVVGAICVGDILWVTQGGFGRGMHGHSHHYHQMNHGNGNGQMAHMQQQMGGPGVQGMQGMQAFNGMMMNQMPMLGMPAGLPDMPHMMGSMAGKFSHARAAGYLRKMR